MSKELKIGVMVSGGLGLTALDHIMTSSEVVFVLTDKKSKAIIERAKKNHIKCFAGNPRNGAVDIFLTKVDEIDVLASMNYLFLIEDNLISLPKKLAFNIHGSLLPKYRGRTPHVWAIINNEFEAGVTAHIIEESCDTGDILKQIIVPIENNDTGAMILEKYAEVYPRLIDELLADLKNGALNPQSQDHSKATFFGKRTSDHGEINWDWSKERIKNWVRAQAIPYPGAFCYYQGQKVIIDEIQFSEIGYNGFMKNGLILQTNPLVIKTSNGTIEVKNMRTKMNKFETEQILY